MTNTTAAAGAAKKAATTTTTATSITGTTSRNHKHKKTAGVAVRLIAVSAFAPSPTNPRKLFDEGALRELAASVATHGVLQAILARPNPRRSESSAKAGEFEIVVGERRWRAAKIAKLPEIPAQIVEMSDGEVLEAQIVENLQRQEVHPLDEAQGFAHLKEASGFSVAEIARRVAKPESYVARRAALVNLIDEAKADLRAGDRITLGHALELCRLTPEVQREALAVACYEFQSVWDRSNETWRRAPDKTRPARHVSRLREWVAENVLLNLNKAAFKKDDDRLREDKLTCVECPRRSGANAGLFHDIKSDSTCLDPACFRAKLEKHVEIKGAEIEAKTGRAPVYITTRWEAGDSSSSPSLHSSRNLIGAREYALIERRGTRCAYAEQAIMADAQEAGRVHWICRQAECKDHRGRAHDSYSRPALADKRGDDGNDDGMTGEGAETVAAEIRKRNERKQELFDIRVDEVVRKRVFAEAVVTYSYPLERDQLNVVASEFFRRVATADQKTIGEVMNWDAERADKYRRDDESLAGEIALMSEGQVARFLMLCTFAHYGANQYMCRRHDQTRVVALSAARGVNHALIDAEARAEKAPKKYRAAHERYLSAIREGGEPPQQKPVVYERGGGGGDEQATTNSSSTTTAAKVDRAA